jgi:ABC-2 type transport system ATP-binding protein
LNITTITSGDATINGLPPSNPDSRKKIGYLPENHRFPDYLTGAGLLELSGKLACVDKSTIESKTEELLELVGMSRWADMKISKYSKGMLQRIGLAQSLINEPDILFLDEPTDGVDPVGKTEIKQILRNIRDSGKSIILNSHLLSEVESVADRVAILSHGKVIRLGSVEELTSRKMQYEVSASFGEILFTIPEEIGKVITLSRERLVVELTKDEHINFIIDQIRQKKISIVSVKPIKISLEQSFIETVRSESEKAS